MNVLTGFVFELTYHNVAVLHFHHYVFFLCMIAQSAGAVEYTDCTSAEG